MTDANITTLQSKPRADLIRVLQNSLYVGAKSESVEMVLSYCDAAKLDPMQKPVHIVPMNTKNSATGNYEWRDVIMPGIGLYRIQADRSKLMAGISEPEFGDEKIETFKDKNGKNITITYPEWCKVAVKKLVGVNIVDFVAKEYWVENYASDSRSSTAPNAMWKKRPRGQIAKCAEAQALRKAFPEIGAAPTAEEMEGKTIDITEHEYSEVQPDKIEPETLPEIPKDEFDKKCGTLQAAIEAGRKTPEAIINSLSTKYTLNKGQIKTINGFKKQGEE